jgi:drug/metabolite transporter (DMT)-like permease
MSSKNPRRQAYLPFAALALLALIWGYNWVIMKVAVGYADPFLFAALRNVLAALTLFAIVGLRHHRLGPSVPWSWTALFGLFQTSGSGLSILALYVGSAGKTSVLTYTMPFWLLLIAWPVLNERIQGIQWVVVGLALAGLIFVLQPWNLRGLTAGLLAVAGGLCWAIASVLFKVIRRRYEVDLLPFTAWQTMLGSIPLILAAVFTTTAAPVWNATFIVALAYNVFIASVTCILVWCYVLHSLPAGTAGISSLAIPVVGVLAAWAQLGEQPGALEAIGMGLIVAALAILTARGLRAGRGTALAEPMGPAAET